MSNVRTEMLWHGRVFDFNREEIVLPNGKPTTVEVIHHPGSSAVIPVLENGSVVLIYQYRPAVRRFIWEIPAGTLHPGEDPLEGARRELREECGLAAKRFEKVGEILVAPGYSDERISLFMATGLSPSEQDLDEDELLTIHRIPFDQAMEMIEKGEIRDAMTISGLGAAYSRIKGKK